MNFEKLTIKTQEALAEANQLAQEYNHQQIEPEHILYALISDPDGVVTATIKRFGVPVDQLKGKLEDYLKTIPKVYGGGTGQAYLSPRSQTMLNDAWKEARALKDEFISSEHLLLAMSSDCLLYTSPSPRD